MYSFIFPLLVVFLAFGAFCFNAGHSHANRVVLKALLKGQIAFLERKTSWLRDNRSGVSQSEFAKCCIGYATIGQLVIGWYRYFERVRSDSELRRLKAMMKSALEEYLSILEAIGSEKHYELDIG